MVCFLTFLDSFVSNVRPPRFFLRRAWEITGCAKVCLKLPNETVEEEFAKIKRLCQERGVAYYLVEDAGRTQIAAGSRTVIGVGPAPVTVVDEITSHLKLM